MISNRTTQEQKSHSASLWPLRAAEMGKVRRHCEQVTATVPLSFVTQTAAWFGLPVFGRVGSSCKRSHILSNSSSGLYPPLWKKASAKTVSGTDRPENSPEITMTGMTGNRRRTTDRNSNPLMFGIRRSEMMMSGSDCLSAARPSKPSPAQRTSYP